ncbi:MAG: DNA polymerase III subunit gamma and tau [Nocardioidaceae bacterium]
MEAPLALYRRYRPETFDEVIGQDHIAAPLRQALANNRVHHAYLFSGPRGCGKTTSARILARTLNCEQAPVAEPCGKCQSCQDLARGGPGSIDVLEIDAASHNGVDDARDLREKAFFSPVASRYKIYILDEAHMITAQGFNALLKLVEEPPPHVKFIFATTEPDRVIGTIRSRTHHYPFRLVPPRLLSDYLTSVCRQEQVTIQPTALPLVVRAGGGSVRDTLSVLDQLIGGAGAGGVTYELAAALLGYTPDSLLDEVVDSFAAGDGASVFAAVDKVVETGQEPRRFAEDLLGRLRDLIIVSAVPGAVAKGLLDVAEDQGDRLESQAARFGAAELTRAAEVVSRGLDEIRGATAPRLLLELICARVLLPGADSTVEGVQARLDRIERRLRIAAGSQPAPEGASTPEPSPAAPALALARAPTPAAPTPAQTPAPIPAPQPAGDTERMSLVDVRRLWPEILQAVMGRRRFAWVILSQHANVHALDGATLTIALANAGARDSFVRSGCDQILRQSLIDVLGVDWQVDALVDSSTTPDPPRQSDAAASLDDPVVNDRPDGHDELLARELGARVIEEIPHDA